MLYLLIPKSITNVSYFIFHCFPHQFSDLGFLHTYVKDLDNNKFSTKLVQGFHAKMHIASTAIR